MSLDEKIPCKKLGVLAHSHNPSIQKEEAGKSEGQPELYSKIKNAPYLKSDITTKWSLFHIGKVI
jgi:hypothetical protein